MRRVCFTCLHQELLQTRKLSEADSVPARKWLDVQRTVGGGGCLQMTGSFKGISVGRILKFSTLQCILIWSVLSDFTSLELIHRLQTKWASFVFVICWMGNPCAVALGNEAVQTRPGFIHFHVRCAVFAWESLSFGGKLRRQAEEGTSSPSRAAEEMFDWDDLRDMCFVTSSGVDTVQNKPRFIWGAGWNTHWEQNWACQGFIGVVAWRSGDF